MLGSLADTFKSPVLGTQSLGQQARHQLLRMPRAASSHAKRHQGARPSDLTPPSPISSASIIPNGSSLFSPSGSRRNHHTKNSKSNGHATSDPNGSLNPSHASDAAAINGHITRDSFLDAPAFIANGFHRHQVIHHLVTADPARRDSLGSSSVSSSSVAESLTSQSSIHIADDSHRRIDIPSVKNCDIHRDPGPIGASIMTVLSSCPAWDTVALLIMLTQFSPFLLSLTYMAFTFLTFVPSNTVTRFNSLSIATVKEVLQVSSFPLSLITMVLVDAVIFLVWLFLWQWLQDLVLDLSKMVIAVSLGGGAGAGGGGWRSFILFLFCIFLSHFSSYDPVSAWLRRVMGRWWVWESPSPPYEIPFSQLSIKGQLGRSTMTILAIHIFTQGLMGYVRGLLIKSQKREAQHLSLPDPEAGKLFSENSSNDPSASSTTSDADPTTITLSSIQSTSTSARKKRRRLDVWLQQPLWSAIAGAKIVSRKEAELKYQQHIGKKKKNKLQSGTVESAPFLERKATIWLVHVDSEEAFFSTSHFPDYPPSENPVADTDNPDNSSLIDQTKPFYIKVNNAFWPSVRMCAIKETNTEQGEDGTESSRESKSIAKGTRWMGKIPGLPSSSNFNCEFVSTHTGEVIATISFRTSRPSTANESDAVSSPSQPPISQRPESPVTTLKNSLRKIEAKRDEQRALLNNTRKMNQAKIKGARKELERLNNSIASAGSNDAKYKNKIHTSTHQKQAWEDQVNKYETDLEVIRENMGSLNKTLSDIEVQFKKVQEKHDRSQSELKTFKTERENEITQLESEETSLMNKRTKVAARLSRMERDLDREIVLNKERKAIQDKMKSEIDAIEMNSRSMIVQWQGKMQKQTEENRFLTHQLQQLQHSQNFSDRSGHHMGHQVFDYLSFGDHVSSARPNTASPQYNPPTLRSMNPAAPSFNPNPSPWSHIPSTMTPNWGTIGTAALSSGVTSSQAPLGRGRSSSILSSISGQSRFSDGGETVATDNTAVISQIASKSEPPLGFASKAPLPFSSSQFASLPQPRFLPGFHSIQSAENTSSNGGGVGSGS